MVKLSNLLYILSNAIIQKKKADLFTANNFSSYKKFDSLSHFVQASGHFAKFLYGILLSVINLLLVLNSGINTSLLIISISLFIINSLICWLYQFLLESFAGDHTKPVTKDLLLGFLLFISSEVMLFFAVFWGWFHINWLNEFIYTEDYFTNYLDKVEWATFPALGTFILGSSSVFLTNSHKNLYWEVLITIRNKIKSIYESYRKMSGFVRVLELTLIFAVLFLLLQAIEYNLMAYSWKAHIYASLFFTIISLHGSHVFVGLMFLLACYYRAGSFSLFLSFLGKTSTIVLQKGIFWFIINNLTVVFRQVQLWIESVIIYIVISVTRYVFFETSSWYWHFVDIVWLFMFIYIFFWQSVGFVMDIHPYVITDKEDPSLIIPRRGFWNSWAIFFYLKSQKVVEFDFDTVDRSYFLGDQDIKSDGTSKIKEKYINAAQIKDDYTGLKENFDVIGVSSPKAIEAFIRGDKYLELVDVFVGRGYGRDRIVKIQMMDDNFEPIEGKYAIRRTRGNVIVDNFSGIEVRSPLVPFGSNLEKFFNYYKNEDITETYKIMFKEAVETLGPNFLMYEKYDENSNLVQVRASNTWNETFQKIKDDIKFKREHVSYNQPVGELFPKNEYFFWSDYERKLSQGIFTTVCLQEPDMYIHAKEMEWLQNMLNNPSSDLGLREFCRLMDRAHDSLLYELYNRSVGIKAYHFKTEIYKSEVKKYRPDRELIPKFNELFPPLYLTDYLNYKKKLNNMVVKK